jgi:hypothetical protein
VDEKPKKWLITKYNTGHAVHLSVEFGVASVICVAVKPYKRGNTGNHSYAEKGVYD